MQEYWESYMKPIERHKAMVSFNAGVSDNVPDMEYMFVGFLKIKLQNPKDDGLVDEEESHDIGFIEDRLEMQSLRYRIGKYVGRIISNAEVNFIFYLKMDFEWSDVITSTMEHFKEYSYEFGSRIDSEWEVYQKLLFPTLKQWQIIANHHACDNLLQQGDTLKQKRAIEHKSYFKNDTNRQKFISLIEKEGFKTTKTAQVPYKDEIMHGVEYYRVDSPYYYDIDELSMYLIDISKSYDGEYDGWESSLVK
jgi:hypothetical protein